MAKLSDSGLAQDGSDGVKHAHFDQAEPSVQHGAYDDHDHLSSASDEDARPVEVRFQMELLFPLPKIALVNFCH